MGSTTPLAFVVTRANRAMQMVSSGVVMTPPPRAADAAIPFDARVLVRDAARAVVATTHLLVELRVALTDRRARPILAFAYEIAL